MCFSCPANLGVEYMQTEVGRSLSIPLDVHCPSAAAQSPQESRKGWGSLIVSTLQASEGNTDYLIYSGF